MAILSARQLTKKFGKFTALDNVDIQVDKGEIYGFIGPNGAGKSTTIRILLGILKPTDGEAEVFGRDVWKEAVEIHKRLAYVPGDVNLWPTLTGGEVVDFFIKMRGGTGKNRKKELAEKFDLDLSKKCGTYSKGNRQKVALVSAFASEADIYILDEPTSGLDPLMERVFQEYVFEAKERGKSVFLSSHILSEVEKLCDRVGIIRQGKIIETGTLNELRHLTRTNLTIETKRPIPSLEGKQGIHAVQKKGDSLVFQVDTEEMDQIIRFISQFGIVRLESAPPTLEDLFMRHYGDMDFITRKGAGGVS